jgi:hypothetical protein
MRTYLRLVKSAVPAVLISIAVVTSVRAAHYVKMVTHAEPFLMMGQEQPARTDTLELWFTETQSCMISPEATVIYKVDGPSMYVINHEAKSYMEIPLSELKKQTKEIGEKMKQQSQDTASEEYKQLQQLREENPEMAEQVEGMMDMMAGEDEESSSAVSATVTRTDETKTIGDWSVRKYIMDMNLMMGTGTSEIWVTKDIDLDYSQYHRLMTSMLSMLPGFEKIWEKMDRIDGVTVLSEDTMNMMGATVKSSTELIEHEEKPEPEGIFEIPVDYSKEKAGSMMGGH